MRLQITRTAQADISRILQYTKLEFGTATSKKLRQRLMTTFDSLAALPGQGRRRPEFTDGDVLFFAVPPFQIVYQVKGQVLKIVSIIRGARDLRSVLRELIQ